MVWHQKPTLTQNSAGGIGCQAAEGTAMHSADPEINLPRRRASGDYKGWVRRTTGLVSHVTQPTRWPPPYPETRGTVAVKTLHV